MSQKSAAEVNAERIETIIIAMVAKNEANPRGIARKIVEEFWELQGGLQQTSERDGSARTIVRPLPWRGDRT
jgi:hypothetical protein